MYLILLFAVYCSANICSVEDSLKKKKQKLETITLKYKNTEVVCDSKCVATGTDLIVTESGVYKDNFLILDHDYKFRTKESCDHKKYLLEGVLMEIKSVVLVSTYNDGYDAPGMVKNGKVSKYCEHIFDLKSISSGYDQDKVLEVFDNDGVAFICKNEQITYYSDSQKYISNWFEKAESHVFIRSRGKMESMYHNDELIFGKPIEKTLTGGFLSHKCLKPHYSSLAWTGNLKFFNISSKIHIHGMEFTIEAKDSVRFTFFNGTKYSMDLQNKDFSLGDYHVRVTSINEFEVDKNEEFFLHGAFNGSLINVAVCDKYVSTPQVYDLPLSIVYEDLKVEIDENCVVNGQIEEYIIYRKLKAICKDKKLEVFEPVLIEKLSEINSLPVVFVGSNFQFFDSRNHDSKDIDLGDFVFNLDTKDLYQKSKLCEKNCGDYYVNMNGPVTLLKNGVEIVKCLPGYVLKCFITEGTLPPKKEMMLFRNPLSIYGHALQIDILDKVIVYDSNSACIAPCKDVSVSFGRVLINDLVLVNKLNETFSEFHVNGGFNYIVGTPKEIFYTNVEILTPESSGTLYYKNCDSSRLKGFEADGTFYFKVKRNLVATCVPGKITIYAKVQYVLQHDLNRAPSSFAFELDGEAIVFKNDEIKVYGKGSCRNRVYLDCDYFLINNDQIILSTPVGFLPIFNRKSHTFLYDFQNINFYGWKYSLDFKRSDLKNLETLDSKEKKISDLFLQMANLQAFLVELPNTTVDEGIKQSISELQKNLTILEEKVLKIAINQSSQFGSNHVSLLVLNVLAFSFFFIFIIFYVRYKRINKGW